MKIFLYSDLHISRTSSILPQTSSNNLYTYRQDMILKTGEFLADIIKKENPDLIINLGDTFDQHTITSYDIDVASKFFKCFEQFNIPHFVLVGNHEMVNQNFNAIEILNNINNITVISEPATIDVNDLLNVNEKLKLGFLPYCNYKDIIMFPEATYLFSHQDIQGATIRGDFKLPDGIEPNTLKDKYKLVFNGHIHKSSILCNVINVGSITTHSFSDDENSIPQCYIFDTITNDLKIFKSTVCPLFRKFTIQKDINELYTYINSLDTQYKYILHIICPFEIKEDVKKYLDDNSLIIANRLNVRISKKDVSLEETQTNLNLQSNIDVKQSFKEFLNEVELKYPIDIYNNILNEVE